MSLYLSGIVEMWGGWISAVSWQVGVLALLVVAIAGLSRILSPRLKYALWLVVLLKLLLPPSLGTQWSIGQWGFASWEDAKEVSLSSLNFQETSAPFEPSEGTRLSPQVSEKREPQVVPTEQTGAIVGTKKFSIVRVSFAVWAIGCLAFVFIVTFRYRRLTRLVHRGREITEGPLHELYLKLASRFGKGSRPRLILSDRFASPFLVGLFRPAIVLPASLVDEVSPGEMNNVLIHELTHWRRRDIFVEQIQVALQILFWFHPAVWFANRQVRQARESICDEEVLALNLCEPKAYGESLLKVLVFAKARPAVSLGVLGVFERNVRLRNRLEGIMNYRRRNLVWRLVGWAFVAVFALVFLPMASVSTEAEPKEAAEKTEQVEKVAANSARLLREKVKTKVTVDVDHSPQNERLSVQYAVIAICEAAEIPYQWDKSAQLADPERRRYIEPVHVKDQPAGWAMADILAPLDLTFNIDENGLYLIRVQDSIQNSLEGGRLDWDPLTVNDAHLAHLKDFEKTYGLDLTDSGVTDQGLLLFKDLPHLGSINLRDTRIGDEGVANLVQCVDSLNYLGLYNTQVTGRALEHLKDMKRIDHLSLGFSPIKDDSLKYLTGLSIKTLAIASIPIGEKGLEHIKNMKTLHTLDLHHVELNNILLKSIGEMTWLERLSVRGHENIHRIDPLSALTNLEILDLGGSSITDDRLKALAGMTRMKKLGLDQAKITGAGLAFLEDMQSLEELDLSRDPIEDSGLASLKEFPSLKELNLLGTPVTDNAIPYLKECPSLRSLNIRDTKITDSGSKELKQAGMSVRR